MSNAIENACPMFIPDIVTTNNPTSTLEILPPTMTPTTMSPTVIGAGSTATPSLISAASERPSTAHVVSSKPSNSIPTSVPAAEVVTSSPSTFESAEIESDKGFGNVNGPSIDDMDDDGAANADDDGGD